jgi:serine/threonine protein phosphatase 1
MALSLNHACVFLRGNHEDMLMNDYQNFLHNGGVVTLKSYGWQDDVLDAHRVRSSIPKEHWDFFRNTVLHHRDALRTYVHAGIYRSLGGVENQSDRVKLWVRHEFLEDPSMDGGYIVHGHTPMENGNVPMQKPNRINLDTGAAFGGRLTAAAFNELEVEPECILQVDSPRRLREVP